MSEFERRSVVLIVDVDLDRLPAWEPGPLPVQHGGSVASGEARHSYFNERAAHALYGPHRVHKWASPEVEKGGLDLIGLEVLRASKKRQKRNALLIVHGVLAADGAQAVESLARLAHVEPWYEELLDGAGRVGPSVKRAATLTLVTPSGALKRPLARQHREWSPELQWLWLLASGTPADVYLPPPEWAGELEGSLVRLSDGWQALVLRDGAAFLGSGPDISDVYRLFPDAELHFRSIYLDALLLGHIQRLRLSEIADDLAVLGDAVRYPERLRVLELELAEFRNVFWWQQLGPHWHGNELLRAYQKQQEIPALFDQVIGELQDYSRQAQTAAAQRTSALLGVLSIVGVPFGFAVGLVRAIGVEDWRWVLFSLLLAAAFSAAVLSTRAGRTLVRPWRPPKR